ncbi:NAD dependent epimerase/dehydratase [Xylariaceae sp. FL0804]|nr:NAD dependent epimerase/dehydratase [Xylariaceae sp. FL0804]
MATSSDLFVLVTGAAGTQGGATVKHLLRLNARVRALVRSTSSPAALELQKQGVQLAPGNFDDVAALATAMDGVSAVYMNVSPSFEDAEAETRHANNILTAATQPGSTVKTVVHGSTILTGTHGTFPGWDLWNDFARQYWINKAANEESVRKSGVPNWTILRPSFFMSNYLPPLAAFFFPELLSTGLLRTSLTPDTPTMFISPDDIGRFAAAALTEPERFRGCVIDLGSEALTPPQIAEHLSKASRRVIKDAYFSKEETDKLIRENHTIAAQTYFNERSSKMDVEGMKARWGIIPATFAEFLEAHEDVVKEAYSAVPAS